jgi:hypothetical protein
MPSWLDIYTVRGGASDIARIPQLTATRSQLVTQDFPPYTEFSRLGYGFRGMSTSATAALVVRPSTTAAFTLYNGSTDKNYVIDEVGHFNLVTTDVIATYSLWECLHPVETLGTADITAIKSYTGNAYSGSAVLDNGATVTDDGWFPVSRANSIGNPGTTTPGGALVTPREGRIIVKPGNAYSLQTVASVVGSTFTHMISWYEVPLDSLPLQ